jgi:glycosyltransferase involved in cell wall biosynthesis
MNVNKIIVIIGTTDTNMYGFRCDFIKASLQQDYEVYCFVSEYTDQGIQKLESIGAKVVRYQLSRGGLNPFADLNSMLELKRKLLQIKPNIVFAYSTKPIIYGTLAAQQAKVPRIYGMIEGLGSPFTVHQTGETLKIKFTRFMQVSLYRLAFPYLDKILFLNPDDPKDLIGRNQIKCKENAVQVLGPIGLNLSDYAYRIWDETQQVSFIFIARLLAEKGIFDFLAAAKIVKNQYDKAVFKIIGGLDLENPSGLSKEELDRLVASGLIEYDGFVTDVAYRIQNSAVFVLPSYYREGVPRSTQEAMAIGRPVITTDVPGCRETVVNEFNGFLVPKWNPEILAEKMKYFIENPSEINRMGKNSYLLAQEHFDAQKVNQQLLHLFEMG